MATDFFATLDIWDVIAFIMFMVVWIGYGLFIDAQTRRKRTLTAAVTIHRQHWAQRMIEREVRIGDTAMVANLMSSISFLASTTMLILGGALALLGSVEHTYAILMGLPYVQQTSKELYELKILLLALIFVYAFFKFTWSLQQFNFFTIMMGSAPESSAPEAEKQFFAKNIARVNELGGRSYHQGVRAYYFAFAVMAWFLHYGLFIAFTIAVTAILCRREFYSRTFRAISRFHQPEASTAHE